MGSRDRSTPTPSLAQTKTQSKKLPKREYLGSIKKTEKQLSALQRDVQEQQQIQQEQHEKNVILAGLIYVQERTKAIYDKHKRWLAAGGPTAEELKLQEQLEAELQVHGCHWCLYALETASWEQLQAALTYDCTQWNNFLNKYFQKLVFLSELLKRPAEQQAELLQTSNASSPAWHVPLVYNFQGLTDTPTPAWAAVLEALRVEGSLAILALLHGNTALYEAASRHAVTEQECVAPPTYWAKLAQRMRFTRLQKLHFRLALENHERQARVAAAQGLSVLHQSQSYAFLLACEAIAAQQQGTEGLPGSAAAPEAAAPEAAAAAAAASFEAAGVANGCQTSSSNPSSNGSQPQQPCTPESSAMGTPSPPPAVARECPAAAVPARSAAAAGESSAAAVGDAAAVAAAAAAALAQELVDEDMPQSPGVELEHKMALYLRQWVALNLFLKDTMTPEQNLIMSMGSYPFWPLPASICGAAIQLPDDDDNQAKAAHWQDRGKVALESIDLLLSQRRYTMSETHDSMIPYLMKLQL